MHWESRPGPEDLGGEDNAMARGRATRSQAGLSSVRARRGSGPARLRGRRVALGCRTILHPGTTGRPSLARQTARLCSPIHTSCRPADFGTWGAWAASGVGGGGWWRKPEELERSMGFSFRGRTPAGRSWRCAL